LKRDRRSRIAGEHALSSPPDSHGRQSCQGAATGWKPVRSHTGLRCESSVFRHGE
jgi:hypothetical protein